MAKKEKQQAEPVQEAMAPAAPQQEQQPSLNLQDLILVAQIIQVSSQRGAFKAEELADVGGLYNKLVVFLQSTGAIAPAPAPTPTEEK